MTERMTSDHQPMMDGAEAGGEGLDPADWEAFRATCYRAVDRLIDWWSEVRERPVWRPVPDEVKATLRAMPPPTGPMDPAAVVDMFERLVLPYPAGNTHPRFMGWVNGSGTPVGALAELLSGALNANVGGRDHAPVYVERQVVDWARQLFGFPEGASGLLTSGTSIATLIGLTAARQAHGPGDVRRDGLQASPVRLVGYASAGAHASVAKAFELLGLGHESLRSIPGGDAGGMDIGVLERTIAADQAAGLRPFCVVATAGAVNTGAIDDLEAVARTCRERGLWMHVDGAFGALAVLSPELAPRLAGIEKADSLAFDFHKWLHVPYDAGCVLVRDEPALRDAFSLRHDYLAAAERGLAGGNPWYCEYGPEQSRGFRALKVWFTLLTYGLDQLGAAIARNCAQARYLGERVAAEPELELLTPVWLNIACFRYRGDGVPPADLDLLNAEIVADLHEQGVAAPSSTRVGGALAIRACLCNHRTERSDLDALVDAVLRIGRARTARVNSGTAWPEPVLLAGE
jgi:glutamate/tyrosine decarboxylase-like PLP-dependent enzyme